MALFIKKTTPAVKVKKAPPVPVSDDGELKSDFRIVDIDLVESNDYNPNEMDASAFESIVETMKREGVMKQPVIVREDPANKGRFIVIDGEHRWRAVKFLNKKTLPVIVVPESEDDAKITTIAMNNLKGKFLPIKLARLLVDIHRTHSPEEVRRLTGLDEDQQVKATRLLDVPAFRNQDEVRLKTPKEEKPTELHLMMGPKEIGSYTTAMKRAMQLCGENVTALIGQEVEQFDEAMTSAMGIAGVKLRNVALALICQSFNTMSKEQQEALVASAHKTIYDKAHSDAAVKAVRRKKSDKK